MSLIISIHICYNLQNSKNYSKNIFIAHVVGAVALHHAAFHGHMQCVAALTSVTPTTITDSEGRTPIHAASLRGHKHVIEDLKAEGWKLGMADSDGNTELHMSAWFGSLEVVEYLVAAKLDPYQKNGQGLTPLNFAVREGHHNIENWFMKRHGGSSLKLLHAHELIVCFSSFILP